VTVADAYVSLGGAVSAYEKMVLIWLGAGVLGGARAVVCTLEHPS
jgi:hypothetical protein